MKKSVSEIQPSTKANRQFLIVSDLDGTLLNKKSKLAPKTIKIVKWASAAGHLFCIATGRTPRGSINYYRELGLNTLLVNLNGSMIWHPNSPEFMPINIVFSRTLVHKLLANDAVKSYVDNMILETRRSTHLWKAPRSSEEVKEFNSWFNINVKDATSCQIGTKAIIEMEEDPNTVLLQIKNRANIDKMVYLLKQTFDTFVIRSWSLPSSGNIIEINTKYANKGNSVEFLMSYYGIPRDNTLAFGDGDNDVEMLIRARSGFAMRNGKNSTKLVARYVTAFDNDHAGVAHEIQRFILGATQGRTIA